MLDKIVTFATQVHHGQTDMAGVDYMQHLFAVRDLAGGDTQTQATALLHDVLEDGAEIESFYLFCMGLEALDGHILFESICLLSKNTHVVRNQWVLGKPLNHDEYYQRMISHAHTASGKIAVKVKIADLIHNRDLNRLYGKKGYRSYTGDKMGFPQWVLDNRASVARHYAEYGKRLAQLERINHEQYS